VLWESDHALHCLSIVPCQLAPDLLGNCRLWMTDKFDWMLVFRMAGQTAWLAQLTPETDSHCRSTAVLANGKHSN
jgi:hypothetical protein